MGKQTAGITQFRDVFRNRNFFLLWAGQFVSQFADRFNQMVSVAFVSALAPGSTAKMAGLLIAINIPGLVVAPFAGVFVDRWDKKKTMIVVNIMQGVLLFCLPVLIALSGSVYPVYCVMLGVYILTTFFQPARIASVPALVKRENLFVANAAGTVAAMVSLILGAAGGDIFASRFGIGSGYIFNGVAYFISIIIISFIVFPETKPKPADTSGEGFGQNVKKVINELQTSLQYILKSALITYAVLSIVIVMAAGGGLYVLLIVFVKSTFTQLTGALGIIYSSLGTGLVLGSLVIGRYGQKIKKTHIIAGGLLCASCLIGLLSVAIGLVTLISSGNLFLIMVLLCLLLGMSIGPVVIAVNTLLHEELPENMRGRVFSVQGASAMAAFLIALLAVSRIFSGETVPVAFICVACLMAVSAVMNFRRLKKQ